MSKQLMGKGLLQESNPQNDLIWLWEREMNKLHLSGGQYLLPYSCVLLGESSVRQIDHAKKIFAGMTGNDPGIVFIKEPFLPGRGLVQLLTDSGNNTLIFCNSGKFSGDIPVGLFKWIGFDGSGLLCQRFAGYEDPAISKTGDFIVSLNTEDPAEIPEFRGDLFPSEAALILSGRSLKQQLYRLEHKYFTTEKLLSLAALCGMGEFPAERLEEAISSLLLCMFKIFRPEPENENELSERIDRTSIILEEELAEFRNRICNALSDAHPGEVAILLVNPHPFDVESITEVELPGTDNEEETRGIPLIYSESGKPVAAQFEQNDFFARHDKKRRIVFRSSLPAGTIARYSLVSGYSEVKTIQEDCHNDLVFPPGSSQLEFDNITGFPQVWKYSGTRLMGNGSMRFAVADGNSGQVTQETGIFRIKEHNMTEHGPARMVAESLYSYNNSEIKIRYLIPAVSNWFDVEMEIKWPESGRTLKWEIPVGYGMNCIGRTTSGITCCRHRKREYLFRDWLGLKNFEGEHSFSICSDGAYGYDIIGNIVRITLLYPSDKGNFTLRFRFIPGKTDEIIDNSFNNSDLFNNPVFAEPIYPSGKERDGFTGISVSDPSINLQSARLDEKGSLIVRLLNPCREQRRFILKIPSQGIEKELQLNQRQLKSWIIDLKSKDFFSQTCVDELIKK